MRGQIILTTVFTLTFALFSIFMLLAPIKDKLLRIKDMENVYQAIANSEKGVEASLLDVFKDVNLYLDKSQSSQQTDNCVGMIHDYRRGDCIQIIYQPIIGLQWRQDEKFIANNFVFQTIFNREQTRTQKIISDGYRGRVIRTIFVGSFR
ncbi:MAG: hypothetical protein KatS3mg096_217 [Candidatus Parcubacteria bacterium]|nr:MAG: hypothetical protein KatS3mg096_217 [Candidatus Parcubacteria bacterium]